MRGHVLLMSLIILLSPGCTYEPGNPPLNEPEDVFEGEPILGCTDSEAKNYNSEANEDDGSCEYDEPEPEPVVKPVVKRKKKVEPEPEAEAEQPAKKKVVRKKATA